uniref:Uncharacterized protein n=2 Tax=Parascaris univalens TaxID=6257 RepID=A0A914ZYZ6_PARUN
MRTAQQRRARMLPNTETHRSSCIGMRLDECLFDYSTAETDNAIMMDNKMIDSKPTDHCVYYLTVRHRNLHAGITCALDLSHLHQAAPLRETLNDMRSFVRFWISEDLHVDV